MYSMIKELCSPGQDCWQNHFWVIEIKDSDKKENTCLIRFGRHKSILGPETFRKSSLALFYALRKIPGPCSDVMCFWMDYLYLRSSNVHIYLSSKPKSVHLTLSASPKLIIHQNGLRAFKTHRFCPAGMARG